MVVKVALSVAIQRGSVGFTVSYTSIRVCACGQFALVYLEDSRCWWFTTRLSNLVHDNGRLKNCVSGSDSGIKLKYKQHVSIYCIIISYTNGANVLSNTSLGSSVVSLPMLGH